MSKLLQRLSLVFAAGAFGGLLNSLAVWLCGEYELTWSLGVRLAPQLTPEWLYPRIVWGGVWGALFLLPLFRSKPLQRGLFFSLGPSLMQLFFIFPQITHHGYLGVELGALTPVFVLAVNAVWGLAASLWMHSLK
jgi:hypothetical protein